MEVLSRKRITGLPVWAYSRHNDTPKKKPGLVVPPAGPLQERAATFRLPYSEFPALSQAKFALHSLTQRNKIEHTRLSGLSFAIGPGKKWGRGSTIEVEPEKFGSRCALLGRGYKDLRDGSSFR